MFSKAISTYEILYSSVKQIFMNDETKILNIKYNINCVEFVFFKYCFIELGIRYYNAAIVILYKYYYKYCLILLLYISKNLYIIESYSI